LRTPLVVGNWKMNGTAAQARALATAVRDSLKHEPGTDVVVCPPFTAITAVGDVLAGSSVAVGGQNCHWEASGAFTGEIAPAMLAELGCRWVILGHSERRKEFGETDGQINRKVHAALGAHLIPILCVGETGEERRQGLTFTTVEGQLRAGLSGMSAEAIAQVVLAYEPVWAIGTGVNATPTQAAEVHGYLRGLLSELASKEVAQSVRILYGGSVKADNAEALTAEADIDGALVGGASLVAEGFITIVKKAGAPTGAAAPRSE
jgi:triosephosphate isomerase